jgi:hypothetical protein
VRGAGRSDLAAGHDLAEGPDVMRRRGRDLRPGCWPGWRRAGTQQGPSWRRPRPASAAAQQLPKACLERRRRVKFDFFQPRPSITPRYNDAVTYGELFLQNEYEMSCYNLDEADVAEQVRAVSCSIHIRPCRLFGIQCDGRAAALRCLALLFKALGGRHGDVTGAPAQQADQGAARRASRQGLLAVAGRAQGWAR